jgi:pyruvate carboxylase
LKGKKRYDGRPGADLPPLDLAKIKTDLVEKFGSGVTDCDVMSYVMFPKVLEEYLEFKEKYGPVEKLDTRAFLVGPSIAESLDVFPQLNKIYSYC